MTDKEWFFALGKEFGIPEETCEKLWEENRAGRLEVEEYLQELHEFIDESRKSDVRVMGRRNAESAPPAAERKEKECE